MHKSGRIGKAYEMIAKVVPCNDFYKSHLAKDIMVEVIGLLHNGISKTCTITTNQFHMFDLDVY